MLHLYVQKNFFKGVLKNDRMLVAKVGPTKSRTLETIWMPEPNRLIEVRWLSTDLINNE